MKKLALTILVVAGLIFSSNQAEAQLKLPQSSSTQFIIQDLGIEQVSVIYQRPSAKGRTIFGDLVPYGQIWRTGANNATNITFQSEVMIEGQKLDSGTYALFTLPTKEEWTIIFNKNAKQWGAYTYDKADDVLRIKVKPTELPTHVETFTIGFEDVHEQTMDMTLSWEKTKVKFNISVDQKAEIIASIEEAMKGEKKPYFNAAMYYYNNDVDIAKAAEWMKIADKGNTKAPHVKYWKALILAKAGDKAGALKAAEEGLAMAKKQNHTEYIKLITEAIATIKK
ncbi:DUF2911 domain-containing protein [Sphingobacterium lactis]|uniref:DUF2911 domain-containing protein n=1 Tax=Sphingobacterium lactis TaxID=797291 RepID=UPI003EC658F0